MKMLTHLKAYSAKVQKNSEYASVLGYFYSLFFQN